MKRLRDPIITALQEPQDTLQLSASQWDLLVRQGRSTNLLARLGEELDKRQLLDLVPRAPRQHLTSAMQMARRQNDSLKWEVSCICAALADLDATVTLLKGAAYVMAGLELSKGRTFSDVDILVPKVALEDAEVSLRIHGWQGADSDAYDQRYYRKWMHEIPPMRHLRRGTTIDVHHSILPETARIKINTSALFEDLRQIPKLRAPIDLFVLPPIDMFLHSATHLFHEGEFEKGLRDLFDLDALLRELGSEPEFWDQLVARAKTLGLTRPLFYALRYTSLLLGTPVPAHVMTAIRVGGPHATLMIVMDWCYSRALRPVHCSTDSADTRVARFALYVRSHWIRMPMFLLVFHLGRKAVLLFRSGDEPDAIDAAADPTAPTTRG